MAWTRASWHAPGRVHLEPILYCVVHPQRITFEDKDNLDHYYFMCGSWEVNGLKPFSMDQFARLKIRESPSNSGQDFEKQKMLKRFQYRYP